MSYENSRARREKELRAAARALSRASHLVLAYHEAGHAVAARLLGVRVDYVTIRPYVGIDADYFGHCRLEGSNLPPLTAATIRVAADVAVQVHLGLHEDKHGSVREDFGEDVYVEARSQARQLLDTPPAREEVRLLAGRLLRDKTAVSWDTKERKPDGQTDAIEKT